MTASLNEKLRTVKWGKYKTSELFQPQKREYEKISVNKILL